MRETDDLDEDTEARSESEEVEESSSIGRDRGVSSVAKRKKCSSASVAGVVSVTDGAMRCFLAEDSSAREDWSTQNFMCTSMRLSSGL